MGAQHTLELDDGIQLSEEFYRLQQNEQLIEPFTREQYFPFIKFVSGWLLFSFFLNRMPATHYYWRCSPLIKVLTNK